MKKVLEKGDTVMVNLIGEKKRGVIELIGDYRSDRQTAVVNCNGMRIKTLVEDLEIPCDDPVDPKDPKNIITISLDDYTQITYDLINDSIKKGLSPASAFAFTMISSMIASRLFGEKDND